MKEYIVQEWYDNIGILQQKRIKELIRCKDCAWVKWSERDKRYECHCHIPIFAVLPDGFCDKGEEKE